MFRCISGSATYLGLEGSGLMYEVSCGALKYILSSHQKQALQGCPLCGLDAPFCCDWAETAVGVLVGEVGSQPGYCGVYLWVGCTCSSVAGCKAQQ